MNGIPTLFATTGALLGIAGLYHFNHGRRTVGAVHGGLANLCFLIAGVAQPVLAQTTPTQSDEHGEYWMGHYFPYSQYPHGHFDCAHGSTVFEDRRSKDNERRRSDLFHTYNICTRGVSNLMKYLSDYIVVCYANGRKIEHPRDQGL